MSPPLLSPVTRAVLRHESRDILRDEDGRRWPVVDGIPYLRTGREALVDSAVACLAAGDREGALVLLLADQDDWWTGAKPDPTAVRRLARDREAFGLRDAMACLAFDRVGDYFAHRWSDPTYLAGLALIEAHWRPAETAFELACGIGHYARDLARRGVATTGADVVFAKLWLARHWVVPSSTRLLCFDAASPWPVEDERFDLVFCQDAFYFLEPKAEILAALRALAGPAGRVAIGHVHNSGAENLSAGHAMSCSDVERLFPGAALYDDAELTRALVERRAPLAAVMSDLARVEAFAIEDGGADDLASVVSGGLAVPPADASLRLNPLYKATDQGWSVEWPSPRYRAEYEGRATFPPSLRRRDLRLPDVIDPQAGAVPDLEAVRRRVFVDLPERW